MQSLILIRSNFTDLVNSEKIFYSESFKLFIWGKLKFNLRQIKILFVPGIKFLFKFKTNK